MCRLFVLVACIAVAAPAFAQGAPNLSCRETKASLKRTGNLYPEIVWETDCKGGAGQEAPPSNNVLNTVCNAFSTSDLTGPQIKFEKSGANYRWTFSNTDLKPFADGTPTTTTQGWTITINPADATFTAVNEMHFAGGKFVSNEIAVSSGTCEAKRS